MVNAMVEAAADSVRDRPLDELEAIIEQGQQTFVQVGLALMEIRTRRLFTNQGYTTFSDYCRQRWHFTPVRATQLIQAAEVVEALTIVTAADPAPAPVPANEGQARPLAALRHDPPALAAAWQEVVEEAPKAKDGTPRVTTALVQEVVERRQTKPHAVAHDERLTAYEDRRTTQAAAPRPAPLVPPYGQIVEQDARSYLRWLKERAVTVDVCVTSPPYWSKRTYLADQPMVMRADLTDEQRAYVEAALRKVGLR